jgi:hypothetical protein
MTTVEEYIEKQKSPQKEICRTVRRIILETIPGVHEQMKMDAVWYEDKVYVVALRDRVTIGFSLAGLSKEQQTQLNNGEQMLKHITILSLQEIDETRIKELLLSVLS